MAAGVRFTAGERELLRRKLAVQFDPKEKKLADSILEKLEKSELVKRKGPPGIELGVLLGAFREELGDRLVPPIGGVIGMVLARAKTLGLSVTDWQTVAQVAAGKWTGRIKAESLVRNAEVLLAEASDPHPTRRTSARDVAAIGMEDI